ncbi:hypothetical protein [Streptomyces sp. NPDC051286]|uniref:hypothetical protein n=1 Tax=Streptomyces sp. NPDC051286 TaxID=3365647 RepID=UPI00379D5F23
MGTAPEEGQGGAGRALLAVASVLVGSATVAVLPGLVLLVAVIRGLLNGRIWARALSILTSSVSLGAAAAVLLTLGDLATPKKGLFPPEPPDVAVPVTLTVLGALVQILLLYAMAGRRGAEFFDKGR